MLKDVTFGQYYPGESLLHRTDARIKILILIEYIVLVLAAKSLLAVVISVCFALFTVLCSKIKFSVLLKSVRPLVFVLVFTGVINIFFATSDSTPLFELGFIKIYTEGIVKAIHMIVRLLLLVLGSGVLLSFTTQPLELTDAIERLLSPLKAIKVPVHEFAMMMSIALRFIPTLIDETNKIISAQKARGADFETGSIISRAKALLPVLIPLFVSAFRRAEELADAMECRCYRGGKGRTRLKVSRTTASDWVFLALTTATAAGVFFANRFIVSGVFGL